MPIKKIFAIWSVVSCLVGVASVHVHAQDAMPTPVPLPDDFSVSFLNHSSEYVKERLGEPKETTVRYNVVIVGLPASVEYVFTDDRLTRIRFASRYHRTSQDYTDDFARLRELLTTTFGEPTETDIWTQDTARILLSPLTSGWMITIRSTN